MTEYTGRVSTPHGEGRIVRQVAGEIVIVEFVGGIRRTYLLDEIGSPPEHGSHLEPLLATGDPLTTELKSTGQ